MSFTIRGIGTALPPNRVLQEDAARFAKAVCSRTPADAKLLDALYRHTQIDSRHTVMEAEFLPDIVAGRVSESAFAPENSSPRGPTTDRRMARYRQESLPLALESAEKALAEAGMAPNEITHLVTISCTGFAAPGFDIGLMKALDMDPGVQRTNVAFMGCHGAFNGLRVADALASADAGNRIMVCSVELCSLHFHYAWDTQKMVGNALFADGAGCVVGDRGAENPGGWRIASSASRLFPDSEGDMSWQVGDFGFDMHLSNRIPDLIAANLRPWIDGWLSENGLTVEGVGSWAIHPGGPRILRSIAEVLCLPTGSLKVSHDILARYGNMSSATILFILQRMRGNGLRPPCVALGFGPGLVAEAILFR